MLSKLPWSGTAHHRSDITLHNGYQQWGTGRFDLEIASKHRDVLRSLHTITAESKSLHSPAVNLQVFNYESVMSFAVSIKWNYIFFQIPLKPQTLFSADLKLAVAIKIGHCIIAFYPKYIQTDQVLVATPVLGFFKPKHQQERKRNTSKIGVRYQTWDKILVEAW